MVKKINFQHSRIIFIQSFVRTHPLIPLPLLTTKYFQTNRVKLTTFPKKSKYTFGLSFCRMWFQSTKYFTEHWKSLDNSSQLTHTSGYLVYAVFSQHLFLLQVHTSMLRTIGLLLSFCNKVPTPVEQTNDLHAYVNQRARRTHRWSCLFCWVCLCFSCRQTAYYTVHIFLPDFSKLIAPIRNVTDLVGRELHPEHQPSVSISINAICCFFSTKKSIKGFTWAEGPTYAYMVGLVVLNFFSWKKKSDSTLIM